MTVRSLAAIALAAAVLGGVLVTWWLYPDPIITTRVEVPQLRGTLASQAVADLAALGLRGRLADPIADPLVAEGAVSWQSPAPFTVLPESAVVRLGISSGPPVVVVPDLVDLDLTTAALVLEAAGLRLGAVDSSWSRIPRGMIILTRPDARAPRRAGGVVDVTISRGREGVSQ